MGYTVVKKGSRTAVVHVTGQAGAIALPVAELFSADENRLADGAKLSDSEQWAYENVQFFITPMTDGAYTAKWYYGGYNADEGGSFTLNRAAVTTDPNVEIRVVVRLPYAIER